MSAIIQSNKEKEIKPFCGIHLSDIVSKGLIDEAKEYIKQYFFKVEEPQTIYYYNVSKADFIQKEYKQIFTGYLTDDLKYEERHNKKIVDKNLYWWFCNQEKTKYNLEIDIFKPRVYEENGQKYINLFRGFKYQDFKEDEQTEYIKESLTYIHTYMREVLCGSDDSSYKYLKTWTSHLMSGRKMKTCLYFKSTEGLGKSTFSDFLTAVMGDYNVYTTSSNSSLVHQFNGELKNIILVVYEELKCESMGEWARMNGALKNMITGKKIDIEPKGEQRINIANLISVIINSNESPIRLSSTDRRYCLFDISNCREGDYEYFGKLQKLMNDPIIQKAFFYDCKKHATDNQLFDEQAELRKLYTTTKAEELVRVMEAPLKFIKSEYVLKNKAFTPFLSELTEAFNLSRFADKGDVEPTYILKILRGIHIDPYKSTGGRYRFKVEHEQLLKIFTERKLMLEIDGWSE